MSNFLTHFGKNAGIDRKCCISLKIIKVDVFILQANKMTIDKICDKNKAFCPLAFVGVLRNNKLEARTSKMRISAKG